MLNDGTTAWRQATVGIIGLLAIFALACDTGEPPVCESLRFRAGAAKQRNVILVINEAMRRDRIGAYGGQAQTPVLDEFARDNLLFERAFTQAPWTKPSMATLWTSLFPTQHGVVADPGELIATAGERRSVGAADVLTDGFTTLAEVLSASGYRTAAFVAHPELRRGFGFEQGFDLYEDSFADLDASGDALTIAVLEWLETAAGESNPQPYFLYVHYMDRPSPEQHRLKQIATLEQSYDHGIERFDQALGRLLAGLARHDRDQSTAIVVTSDHGEALFERGYGGHGHGLYEDEAALPLVARLPGVTSVTETASCPVGLIDVLPTLCGYLGVQCPETLHGADWLAEAPDPREPRIMITEGVLAKPGNRALRLPGYTLLWQPQLGPDGQGTVLFNTLVDPHESADLRAADSRDEPLALALERLSAAAQEGVPAFERPASPRGPLSDEQRQRLRALGYLD